MPRAALQKDLFSVIAHPLRRAVLIALRQQDLPATQLGGKFDVTASALSQHLRALKDSGLVAEKRVGRHRIYSLRAAALREVADWVEEFAGVWPARKGRRK
jgi:DNA-binding transcriptional ArsR family regulator